ncbi:MAG: DNA polymerase III subunit beta [Deltaproteobacteria bacterium]|nr:DNA polymerase III subunit beta [Deltaproteobacteria bacterium]
MEIKVNRDSLFKSVSKVQSIIEKRSNMPILSTILITADDRYIYISATDLEISMQQKIEATVLEPGSIAVKGRMLFEILKESKSNDISMKEKENNFVFIHDDKTQYNLACMSAEEYPVFVEPEDVEMVEMECAALADMISKTIYAITLEEAGYKLSGVFTEKVTRDEISYLRMVSTDGHRLSLSEKQIDNLDKIKMDKGVMIPKKGLLELNKLTSESEKISIGFKENNCVAKNENSLVVIRLLENKFPDYTEVISIELKNSISVNRNELLEGMRRMMILNSESSKGVQITLQNNIMELISINPDLGNVKDSININYPGETVEMGFNSKYFVDALQSMISENILLSFNDNSSPCMLRGEEDKGFLGLIMPMRI